MDNAIIIIGQILSNVHWLPVLAVTALSFVVGAVWHLPFLFGKIWKNEVNPDGMERKINKPLVFGIAAILHFLAFANLSLVVAGLGALPGFLTTLQISLVWITPALGALYLFAGRSWRLLAIDSGLYVVLFSLGGLILGVW